ncbi:uncharacterized protein C8A04DRAFT_34417 [Dichotomopilus funicola]|uniref:DUF6546 domain-containing protein n=1 Tax=Dichotomopilus funicola TaxID=1934379 RepID=A0AAN6V9E4_9PEZI|nr:hypothetical protein C8A04DRAFT_34417 [Dichotomopilus funicola]
MPPLSPHKPRGCDMLPPEIRDLIVQALIQDGCTQAPLPAVLTPSRLADFRSIIQRNRALVDYIWFCLELDDYDCTKCAPGHMPSPDLGESMKSITVTDTVKGPITALFEELFSVLSTWDPVGDLVLDISIYSPSDSEHWFKYLTFLPDYHGQTIPTKVSDDAEHGWVAGYQEDPTSCPAFLKVFHEVMLEGPFASHQAECAWWDRLPSVPAVTSVLLRQQNRRRWKPQVLPHMFARFPRLEEVHYEPWREWNSIQKSTDNSFLVLFAFIRRFNIPLKKLVVFENFNQQYPTMMQDLLYTHSFRQPNPAVGRMVALASLHLEHLAASFLVDAWDIFTTETTREWPSLTSLVLTSKVLRPDEDPVQITAMLHAAAGAAMRMPRLESMEIWHGRKGLAVVFRYRVVRSARHATITWRATWGLTMSASLIRDWKAVVHRRYDDTWSLGVVQERLDPVTIASHGDAILSLKLSGEVIRPVSLQQIRMEQKALEGVKTV